MTLELTPAAETELARSGFDPIYGARPLKRSLQKLVIDPLANALLAGQILPGDHIEADVDGDHVAFRKGAKGVAA